MENKTKTFLLELPESEVQYIDEMKDLLKVKSRSSVVSILLMESKRFVPQPARFVSEGDKVTP